MGDKAGERGTIRVGVGGWTYEPWRGTFYPKGLAQKDELEIRQPQADGDRDQRHLLPHAGPRDVRQLARRDARRFRLRAQGAALRHEPARAGEAGESIERFCAGGPLGSRTSSARSTGSSLPTKKLDLDDVARFLALLPKTVEGRTLRHAIEVRHPSFRDAAFIALAREHGVAIVVAGDSEHPQSTSPPLPSSTPASWAHPRASRPGYSAVDLDRWAGWARERADGAVPRDVFLFVIGGHKVANPAAAKALIERVG